MLVVKNLPANAGDIRDAGLIPGWGRFPGGGRGNPLLEYSCLENPWTEDPGGLQSMGVAKSQTGLKRLSTAQHTCVHIIHNDDGVYWMPALCLETS